MWWKRETSARRAASINAWVPSTLVRKKRAGSSTARLLWDSAAKLTTTSVRVSRSSVSTVSWSAMSPWSNRTPPRGPGRVLAVARVGEQVEGHEIVAGVAGHPVAHEVGADEAGRPRHEESHC